MGFVTEKSSDSYFRVAVGQAYEPHRCMINTPSVSQEDWNKGVSMTRQGWRHFLEFTAFSSPRPGTKRIVVGEANGPHRCMFNHRNKSQEEWDNGASMNDWGWKELCSFWAFSSPQPGTIRIVVGEAFHPHRAMINHDNYSQSQWNDASLNMSVAGWDHLLEFWAYPPQIGGYDTPNKSSTSEPSECIQIPMIPGRSVTITVNK